jgi:hypothetical protein
VTVVYPHRGLTPTKTTAFVDLLVKHIPQALAKVSRCTQSVLQRESEASVEASIVMTGTPSGASRSRRDQPPSSAKDRPVPARAIRRRRMKTSPHAG